MRARIKWVLRQKPQQAPTDEIRGFFRIDAFFPKVVSKLCCISTLKTKSQPKSEKNNNVESNDSFRDSAQISYT